MANKGKFGGKVLLSEQAWKQLHSEYKSEFIYGFSTPTNFSKGGVNKFA
jgi:hypothetical protein